MKISAIDLFSGAGGFSQGFKESGIETVIAIESDKETALTYATNHPDTFILNEDIREVRASKHEKIKLKKIPSIEEILEKKGIKEIDIIYGGPPCQGFSMSGKRIRKEKSFLKDERNLLFVEFIRMVDVLRPKIFVLENVPGILNYDNGSTKNEIIKKFEEIGYNVSAKVLSAVDFGVPQKRKRAFFIGNNLGIQSDKLFPASVDISQRYTSVWDAIGDLPSLSAGEGKEFDYYIMPSKTHYQNKMRKNSDGIFNHISSRHTKRTIEILKKIKQGETMKDLPDHLQTKSVHSGAYGRMQANLPAFTLTTRINTPSVGKITHPFDDRTITPREAARIQSFPDNYRFIGNITSIGMQIGNSVPPILGQAIGEKIKMELG